MSNRIMFLSSVFAAVLLSLVRPCYAQWVQTNGPYGGMIECLAADGANLYTGTFGGVYRSTDNGGSWSSAGLTNTLVWSLASHGSTLLAGTNGKGVYLSTDRGGSWTQVNAGLASLSVNSLAILDTIILAGTTGGVYLSTNNGDNWFASDTVLKSSTVYSFAVMDTNLLAGTSTGVYISTNTGLSWKQVNNGLTNNVVYALAVRDTNIFAGTGGGVFLSTNSGSNWTQIINGLTNTSVRSMLINGPKVFAGTFGGGLFQSTDNGSSWGYAGVASPNVYALTISGTTVVAGTLTGIYCSTDGGAGWSQSNTGLSSTIVNAFVGNGTSLFAGTYYGGIYRSTDKGSSWTPVDTGLTNSWIYALIARGATLFAGTYGSGVFLSTDNGSSWTQSGPGMTNGNVLSIAVSGTNLIAGTHGGGVYLSTNDGAGWTQINNGLTNVNVYAVAVIDTMMFAGTAGGGVYISTNGGSSWTQVNNGLTNTTVNALATGPDGEGGTNLFAGTYGGVFRSTNNGTDWSRVSTGLPSSSVRTLAMHGMDLFAGTVGGGIFVTMNNGSGWAPCNTGLGNTTIYSLAAIGTDLFTGTYGAGAWRQSLRDIVGNDRPVITQVEDVSGDQGGKVRISWDRMNRDSADVSSPIVSYGVWRKIPAGALTARKNRTGQSVANDTLGLLYDYLGSVNAVQSASYHFIAQTLDDSSQGGPHVETYLVSAHSAVPTIYYISDAGVGYSVDNLAPLAPRNFAAMFHGGAVTMHWQKNSEPDLLEYGVYRGTSGSIGEIIGQTGDTAWLDQSPAADRMYYAVRAKDVHGNLSELSTPVMTGVDDNGLLPQVYNLQQNTPNPFNPTTTLRYGLPSVSYVRLSIYDVFGRMVARLYSGIQQSGYQSVEWNASSMASGVYFYRLEATSVSDGKRFTDVKRMVLVK
jgi:photosystem II stability/assembly factor-like uncharacterized protein